MRLIQPVLCGPTKAPELSDYHGQAVVALEGTDDKQPSYLRLDIDTFARNLLFVGESGSGKTTALIQIIDQLLQNMQSNDVAIVFDAKGDYSRRFYDAERGDIVLGCSEGNDEDRLWNLYEELIASGEGVELDIDEITHTLFRQSEPQLQPFLTSAARQIMGAYLRASVCSLPSGTHPEYLNNQGICRFFQRATVKDYQALANAWPDLNFVHNCLGDSKNSQTLEIKAEIMSMVRNTFIGDFGQIGRFSTRRFVQCRGGKVLFLKYDFAQGEILAPLYSILIDLAVKEALRNDACAKKGKIYFVLDGLKLLPRLKYLDDAVNFGRECGINVLASLQSMGQLSNTYGYDQAEAIFSGFGTLVSFRPGDAATRIHMKNFYDHAMVSRIVFANRLFESKQRKGCVLEDWELDSLQTGQAMVGINGHLPTRFTFHPLPAVSVT